MTVSELMDILKELDPSTRVVLAKFEYGFEEVSEYRIIDLALNTNQHVSDSWGPHELVKYVAVDGHHKCKALLLGELEPNLTAASEEKATRTLRLVPQQLR